MYFQLGTSYFSPFDLVQWMTHVFFNHCKISLFFKASFVTGFPYGPANCSHSPNMVLLAKRQLVITPSPTLFQFREIVFASVFGHHSSSMRAGLHLNYYRHITEEAELFFFFSLVCNFLALRDTHTLIKQSKNEKLTFSLVVNWKSCLPALSVSVSGYYF